MLNELGRRYPDDTIVTSVWAPVIRAALGLKELKRGNAVEAIEELQIAARYEAAAEFWPQYLRGEAYLKLGRGEEAAAELRKFLDHRGQSPLSVLYPLAHPGSARAAAIAGDRAKSRGLYEDFFAA